MFPLPDSSTLIASTSAYSAPIFTNLLPIAEVIIGFGLAIGVIILLIRATIPHHKS